jgi:hypothetical protein
MVYHNRFNYTVNCGIHFTGLHMGDLFTYCSPPSDIAIVTLTATDTSHNVIMMLQRDQRETETMMLQNYTVAHCSRLHLVSLDTLIRELSYFAWPNYALHLVSSYSRET